MYKYPEINELSSDSILWGRNVYFIKPYDPGLSLKTEIVNDDVLITIFNWDGTIRDNYDNLLIMSIEKNNNILEHFRIAGINKYQLFVDNECAVIDLVVNQEFVSPGMLSSLLSANHSTQTTLAQGVLTEESLAKMIKDYQKFIIKPMTKMCIDNQKHKPNYARIL